MPKPRRGAKAGRSEASIACSGPGACRECDQLSKEGESEKQDGGCYRYGHGDVNNDLAGAPRASLAFRTGHVLFHGRKSVAVRPNRQTRKGGILHGYLLQFQDAGSSLSRFNAARKRETLGGLEEQPRTAELHHDPLNGYDHAGNVV